MVMDMKIIARIKTDFPDKFGVPRQSGMADGLVGRIIFEEEYRNPDALRGLEDFTHLWLIWGFSLIEETQGWRATVRPPRLGGNKRVGVFATRSPYRPNPIGLSSVRLEKIDYDTGEGPVIYVSGIDMADNTPIYDIKPYLPYVDSHSDASDGFAKDTIDYALQVCIDEKLKKSVPQDKLEALIKALSYDPRPSYQNDAERVYGMRFADLEIKFKVNEDILTVCDIIKASRG